MTDDERLLSGLILFYMGFSYTVTTLLLAVGRTGHGYWWSLIHALVALCVFLLIVRADRRATRDRVAETKPGAFSRLWRRLDIPEVDPADVVAVPVDAEIADEVKEGIAEGWRIRKLEKPREL